MQGEEPGKEATHGIYMYNVLYVRTFELSSGSFMSKILNKDWACKVNFRDS